MAWFGLYLPVLQWKIAFFLLWIRVLCHTSNVVVVVLKVVEVVVVAIIIALNCAIRDFLQSPHCAANRLQHVRSNGPGAIMCNHVQHIERLSRATCRVMSTPVGLLTGA